MRPSPPPPASPARRARRPDSSAGRYVSITCASYSSPSARSSRAASRYASAASRRRLRSRRRTASSSASPSFSAFWSSESTRRSAPTRSRSPAFMADATSDLMRSAICKHLLVYARPRRRKIARSPYPPRDRRGPWTAQADRPDRPAIVAARGGARDPALPIGPHVRHALRARPRVARLRPPGRPGGPGRPAVARSIVPRRPIRAGASNFGIGGGFESVEAVQTPARVNVTCVTPLGEEMASIS